MIAVIAKERIVKEIQQAVEAINETISYNFVGEVDSDEFENLIRELMIINLDTIIIDLSVCDDDEALLSGIELFRMNKDARIVILAANREAGDSLLAELFNIGVYDFITFSTEEDNNLAFYLENQLTKPYQYANGLKYKHAELKKTKKIKLPLKERKGAEVQEKIVYRDRFLGSIVIAVAGVERRTGTTSSALKIAEYLAALSNDTAYIEYAPDEEMSVYRYIKDKQPKHLTIYQAKTLEDLIELQANEHKYYILDLGAIITDGKINDSYYEFVRSDIRLITMGASEWDFERHLKVIKKLIEQNFNKPIKFIVNYASTQAFQDISNFFQKNDLPLKVTYYHQDENNQDKYFRTILGDVLTEPTKNKLSRLLFR